MTSFFFDSEKVIAATDKAERRNLSKAGAFIRRSARSSIRKTKKTSLPGQPPRSHVGLLRDRLFFEYDISARAVVAGPEKAKPANVPQLLEYGGSLVIREVYSERAQKWYRQNSRFRNQLNWPHRTRTVQFEARPYMFPAYKANESKFPELWRDSIK
ncbi:MAG: hypothetical protein NT069_33160 [Planctomycetota bacterium]|nr:hypothetical protein [Planctomycetota bacterium]